MGYTAGKLTSIPDPLSHQATIAMNAAGQLTNVTDALSHTWQFGYTNGDLTSMTNPLGAVRQRVTDAAGRVLAVTDPLGRMTRLAFDKLKSPDDGHRSARSTTRPRSAIRIRRRSNDANRGFDQRDDHAHV